MEPSYTGRSKLTWYEELSCPVCGGEVNSWDKRCSRALGYKAIVCEGCIAAEYETTIEELRATMIQHWGLLPCPGL